MLETLGGGIIKQGMQVATNDYFQMTILLWESIHISSASSQSFFWLLHFVDQKKKRNIKMKKKKKKKNTDKYIVKKYCFINQCVKV